MRSANAPTQSMGRADTFEVTVVYALATRQETVSLRVAPGCTIAEAVRRSGLNELREDPQTQACLGVFGERRESSELVRAGDQIEIYRPLLDDPKVIRRRRAQKQPL